MKYTVLVFMIFINSHVFDYAFYTVTRLEIPSAVGRASKVGTH